MKRYRYQILLSEPQREKLQQLAERKATTSADVLRRLLDLGLALQDSKVIVEDAAGNQQRLVL